MGILRALISGIFGERESKSARYYRECEEAFYRSQYDQKKRHHEDENIDS